MCVRVCVAEVKLLAFLISALDRRDRSASRTSRFISGARAHSTHYIERWVGSRPGMNSLEKIDIAGH